MSVSTGVVSFMIPEIDFLGLELSEIEIVLESLEDCVGAVDTVDLRFLSFLHVICCLSQISMRNLYSEESLL